MTAAVLIKNGGGFINLGHWVVGGGGAGIGLDMGGQGPPPSSSSLR